MIIGIDASRATRLQKTGVEWYSHHLIQHLKKVIPDDVVVRLYSPEPLASEFGNLPKNWESCVLKWPPKYLWTLGRLSWEMLRRPPDLLFQPSHVLPLILPKQTVTTIHDIGFERYPEVYPWQQRWYHHWNTKRALRVCSNVITISDWSAAEIKNVYGKFRAKVSVVLLAHDSALFNNNISAEKIVDARKKYNLTAPYFIFVGRLEGKKNILRIIEAFAEFKKENSNYDLVLIGPAGNMAAEALQKIKKENLDSNVKILSWIAADDLPALLRGASALVFPTLYEGFGLPILESFAVGTPVITSNRGANSEVAGEAALLVNPENMEEIAKAMQSIVKDQSLVNLFRVDGLARAQQFSWQKTAAETWEVILG